MASRIRIHSPVGKFNTPINTTLVAKQQKKQPTNAPKLDCPDPKFNFDLSKIPVSSPHRSSQPSLKINPKLRDNKSSEKERETEPKKPETAIQAFTPSPPGQPQEADETKKWLQQPEVKAKSESQPQRADVSAEIKRLSRYNFDLSKIPISAPNRPPVQSKQNVDISFSRRVQQSIKRDRLSTKEDNSQELTAPSTASSDLESSIQQTKGGGNPLEDKVREPMEQAFGADFSGVRIHTDSSAVGMNQELGAQAFTHGHDIYFNDGKFTPQSSEGKHLLAHELTHTVQQGASIQRKVNIFTGLTPKLQLWGWSSLKERAIRKLKGGLNSLAEHIIPGYSLLNVVLGKNLITGEKVARSGINLIKGYMGLSPLFGEILFRELQETETLPQAGKWVEGKVAKFGIDFNDISRRLKLFWNEVSAWKGIEGNLKVFKKYLGPVIGKVMAFSSVVMEKVKELRFEGALRLVGATELLNALKQDPKAFKKAVDNPKDVLKQFMTGALKKGFANFKDNFVTHFKNALLGWLFGKAAEMGIQMPKEFSVAGIFSLVAQLVGATYQQIRKTVVKRLGAKGEKIVSKLETAVSFIKNLVTKGPVALWEMVASSLSNLKEMLFSQIATLVSTEIIKAAVTKLLSMLNPAGAIVQLALTLYRVIKFFIDQWETIKSVALGILNSIAMVALNKVGAAASFVEKVMAQGMKLIISFLARIFGLGGIVGKVKALIKKLSNPVKKAIAKVVDWIVVKGKKAAKKLFKGKKKDKSAKGLSKDVKAKVKKDTIKLTKKQYKTVEEFDKALEGIYLNYKSQGLQSLSVKGVQTDPDKPFQIVAKASPETPVTLVKWKDLFKEGTEPEGATKKFAKAGDSTHALLIVNNQPVTKVVRSDKKGHAEDNLMNTSGWKNALNKAYQDAVSVPPKKTDIKVVINRTPCHKRCSPKLSNELNKYWQRFNKDDTKQYVNFYLIATGVYETKGSLSNREAGGPTTNRDLEMLARAGWHLQGLQVGEKPTSRGKILSDYLQKMLTKLRKVKAP